MLQICNIFCNFAGYMKKKRYVVAAMALAVALGMSAERVVEPVPFGDFEQWTVRQIKESKILGGKTKTIYSVAPNDTIIGPKVFTYGQNGNPWSVSNVYANVAGIVKASGTTRPEKREDGKGTCCRLDVRMEYVTAANIIDIHVLVPGTVFWGRTIEPVKTADDPYQNIDFGVPFTKRPTALMLDYKCKVSPEQWVWRAKGLASSKKKIKGHDECELYMLLQHRWEDSKGKIHSIRVGTAYQRMGHSVPEWQNDVEIPVHYGDITCQPWFQPYMGLNTKPMRAMNSKGKITYINEEGWDGSLEPTHAILMLTGGCYEAFVGYDGNTLWVDNVRLVYDK